MFASPGNTNAGVEAESANVERTATISMYLAAQILGYTPYHMEEAILDSECKDLEVINEALVAQYNCFSRIQRYTKGDWENSFKQYDVSQEEGTLQP